MIGVSQIVGSAIWHNIMRGHVCDSALLRDGGAIAATVTLARVMIMAAAKYSRVSVQVRGSLPSKCE